MGERKGYHLPLKSLISCNDWAAVKLTLTSHINRGWLRSSNIRLPKSPIHYKKLRRVSSGLE